MIINLISSPRNISTALMYSFAQRADCKVIDEPFYGLYLLQSGMDHPGRDEIIESQPKTVGGVIEWINELHARHTHVFVKNMAHHLVEMDTSFLMNWKNVLLIRDPKKLITSFAKVIRNPTMSDIGVRRQEELEQTLSNFQQCPIIDSGVILTNPKAILGKLCEQIGIPFDEAMLSWQPGAIQEDGVWAKYWYKNVHASNGFQKPLEREEQFPEHCLSLLQESQEIYQRLFTKSIQ
ncbi:MAG: sulfotransferase family protein [Cyclobacteriaceae bacterium]